MAAPIDTPSAGDIWQLSIDDLFALPEAPRLGGPGPFVINLSASSAPVGLPQADVAGNHRAIVYQIQRMEDRRLRYRLRLGPFSSEDDADGVLQKVRDIYPRALTATADADDLRAIATMQSKAEAAKGPHAQAKDTEAATPRAAAHEAEPISTHVLQMQTTETLRALTAAELHDDAVLRWFVIQLSLEAHPFDPETVPDLDIFSVYRLYSVASIDQGKIMHALRLGFFGEEAAALAVSSYLGAYYDKPTIKRVSAAERDRFTNQRLEPRKDVGATGMHAVIEITDERFVREKRSVGQPAPQATTLKR